MVEQSRLGTILYSFASGCILWEQSTLQFTQLWKWLPTRHRIAFGAVCSELLEHTPTTSDGFGFERISAQQPNEVLLQHLCLSLAALHRRLIAPVPITL